MGVSAPSNIVSHVLGISSKNDFIEAFKCFCLVIGGFSLKNLLFCCISKTFLLQILMGQGDIIFHYF